MPPPSSTASSTRASRSSSRRRSIHRCGTRLACVATWAIRTAFNLLGPLTNPAGVRFQLVGVPRPEMTELVARALALLGAERAWVVHGADGIDEVSTRGYTKVSECHRGLVHTFYVHPTDVGLHKSDVDGLAGGTAETNAAIAREILAGAPGPRRDIVVFNAGVALYIAGRADSVRAGMASASDALDEWPRGGDARRAGAPLAGGWRVTTSMPASVLDTIVASTRRSVEVRKADVPPAVLARQAREVVRRPRGTFFCERLTASGPSVIAECKRRSPSRGVLRADYDPVAIAAGYERAGAAAISVLTEPAFFDGHLDHLRDVRRAVDAPLLRKDFVVDVYQLDEAVVAGADAVLLIVAALDDETLRALHEAATARDLAVLVEVHGEDEVDRALQVGARVLGVNNRNLRTLAVDVEASFRLVDRIPHDGIAVAESGLRTADDIARLSRAGYDAFLIGERFMSMPAPGDALGAMMQDARALLGIGGRA